MSEVVLLLLLQFIYWSISGQFVLDTTRLMNATVCVSTVIAADSSSFYNSAADRC